MATDTTASGLTKKTRGFLTASASRACFYERSRMNECNCSKSAIVGRVFILVRPIYYEYESRNELLQLWEIWSYYKKLQELGNSKARKKT